MGSGTRELVLFQAAHKQTPVGQNSTAWWAADNLVYIFIPSECFDNKCFDTKKGIKDSSRLHFFVGRGNSTDTSELAFRAEVCGCVPCLESPT